MFQINWKLKSLLYNIFGFLNLKNIFYLCQKYITKRSRVDISQISDVWKFHSKIIKNNNINSLLEVGAGKSLEQNIYFSYLFKNKICQTAIDINNMIDLELANEASIQISKLLKTDFLGDIKNLKDLKAQYNIEYKAPMSTTNLLQAKLDYDLCVSSTALEHFTKEDLSTYLLDLKKIIKKEGLISSAIDYSDHYSHTDNSISRLNFLKFSEIKWKKYNNSFLYQNRLRHRHYVDLFKKFNYEIIEEVKSESIDPPKKLNEQYENANKDNFILWGYFLIKNT